MNEYPPPVDQLLRLGDPNLEKAWRDYRALGIGPDHLPDLIRMATDADLVMDDDPEEGLDAATIDALGWAPQHALRALGELEAPEAIDPLFEAFDKFADLHDFWLMDLDDVMARIGAAAIPACERQLAEPTRDEYARMIAAESLGKIGESHPELRDRCVAVLAGQLQRHEPDAPDVAGSIVSSLIDLKAVESAPAIEAAFAADCVDPMMVGDWPTVRYELGLGPMPESRRIINRQIAAIGADRNRSDRARPSLKKLKKQRKRERKRKKRK